MAEGYVNDIQTTLNGAIDASTTSVVITSATGFPGTTETYSVKVDNEIMRVSSRTTTTLTVARGAEGTTAASHSTGATIAIVLTASSLKQGLFDYALAPYKTLLTGVNRYPASSTGIRIFNAVSADVLTAAALGEPYVVRIRAADFAVSGWTTKLHLKCQCFVFGTAPGQTLIVGLYPLSGTNAGAYVLGGSPTVVSGSTTSFVSPVANGEYNSDTTSGSVVTAISADFALPSDGDYVVGVNATGTTNASSVPDFTFQLLQHHTA